jgi:hypothetical protein
VTVSLNYEDNDDEDDVIKVEIDPVSAIMA